jgi:hypothetical protein
MIALPTTGLQGLDKILCGLRKGDNVVWQVDSIDDFRQFVDPFVKAALRDGKKVVYMRFATHKPLVEENAEITTYHLDAESRFETFSKQVHSIISKEGIGTHYVFDCLSDLLSAWATDLMIGNFFMITCPYLFELDTIAYFALLRRNHSFKTIARIRETTQLLLDIYRFEGNFYIHPLKVFSRYSPTMFLPHQQQEKDFSPVVSSLDAAKLFSHISEKGLDDSARSLDYWDRLFMEADSIAGQGADSEEVKETIKQLCKIMIGREKRMLTLAEGNFSLENLLNIKSRLIGSGFIGGKAAGMLLAQNILLTDKSFDWKQYLEPHDSFYIGSDVFYSYIVENGWWKLLMEQKTKEGYFRAAPLMKENLLKGKFPEEIRERLQEMVEYFGQSPIIVRSSSLLEDSFGNAFAGKYESIFLVNQGDPQQRHNEFETAVRRIYASTMDEDALTYRLQRGLDQQDEQMALLVQRVSGSYKKHYFFPDVAGVGTSYNAFVWKPTLDPKAGMLRLVFGLGTRAVERVEDDYPQIIALDQPLIHPYSEKKDIKRFSQRNADILDIKENSLITVNVNDLLNEDLDIKSDLIAAPDYEAEQKMKELGMNSKLPWMVTFEKLLSKTDYAGLMQKILKRLEDCYQYPVDIEFTTNFAQDGGFKINVVQCRPLQTRGLRANVRLPKNIEKDKILFESYGYTMGGSIWQPIKKIIYVEPKAYIELNLSQKYDIARLVGRLNRQITSRQSTPTLLIGPGRWGTTMPSLGVSVTFSEINNMTVLAEVAYEGGNLMPELSFGTHFFRDLVETDIFYVAIFPQKETVIFNKDRFSKMPNLLDALFPESKRYADVVKVCEVEGENLQIVFDVLSQKVICFFT